MNVEALAPIRARRPERAATVSRSTARLRMFTALAALALVAACAGPSLDARAQGDERRYSTRAVAPMGVADIVLQLEAGRSEEAIVAELLDRGLAAPASASDLELLRRANASPALLQAIYDAPVVPLEGPDRVVIVPEPVPVPYVLDPWRLDPWPWYPAWGYRAPPVHIPPRPLPHRAPAYRGHDGSHGRPGQFHRPPRQHAPDRVPGAATRRHPPGQHAPGQRPPMQRPPVQRPPSPRPPEPQRFAPRSPPAPGVQRQGIPAQRMPHPRMGVPGAAPNTGPRGMPRGPAHHRGPRS